MPSPALPSLLSKPNINKYTQENPTHLHTPSSPRFFFFRPFSLSNLLYYSWIHTNKHAYSKKKKKKKTQASTPAQYPVLEMCGGRLLRRRKPSVNDSSCGKIMFLMQRQVRCWWKKMTFWMVKWVNVRSWPQRSHSPHPPSIPPSLVSPLTIALPFSLFPSTRLFIEKARGGFW